MATDQKMIKAKIGVMELVKQSGNVSQIYQLMSYGRDSFYRVKELCDAGAMQRSK
jgi:hypothetical protein